MRHIQTVFLVAATFLAVCTTSSATPNNSKLEAPNLFQSGDAQQDDRNARRFLRTDENAAATEERAIDLKKIFDARIFSTTYLNLMKYNEAFRLKMFKKWDQYSMEQIKVATGQAKLRNPRLAKVMVEYVQDHRVYGQWNKLRKH
ncbi:hypothetical protein PF005_g29087 [Phytophthora fragariae]|uniref:RxLR effector protein n=1 Tax=Phytophthora fragariae TaxID=53985 RepID=A0A6A3VSX7_9STRA|nr:hypothetical protein PF003_g3615 [Phytophthora fragariae]KAE8920409.1 hypothetical protein PF009_g29294 [Phytophthora fragariae]KAE8966250.1 hypothetical protein PF011_g28003 [Phytophthora fragariae]KAE9064252.1 hypothetical protein PF010_g28680 [Phytophthora fragariae]KAE9065173.1 hypothetical protein PF007_g28939 [Phytophthora fragariae]